MFNLIRNYILFFNQSECFLFYFFFSFHWHPCPSLCIAHGILSHNMSVLISNPWLTVLASYFVTWQSHVSQFVLFTFSCVQFWNEAQFFFISTQNAALSMTTVLEIMLHVGSSHVALFMCTHTHLIGFCPENQIHFLMLCRSLQCKMHWCHSIKSKGPRNFVDIY